MIRLTELGPSGREAVVRIEGNLDEEGLRVLAQALDAHALAGRRSVRLDADGIVSVDMRALREWSWSALPRVTVRTTRRALQEQLEGTGFRVLLIAHDPSAAGDRSASPPGPIAGENP